MTRPPLATEEHALKSLRATTRSVAILILEQIVLGVLILLYIPSYADRFNLAMMLVFVPFGIPAMAYAILLNALVHKNLAAAITLLTFVTAHTIAYLVPAIYGLTQDPFTWPEVSIVGFIIPMAITIVALARSLRTFKYLPGRQPPGFQVVLPIDNSLEK